MALSLQEQAKQLIEKNHRILLVAHAKMDGDTLSATIAMHLLLQKMGKETVVACADPVPEEYAFLPETKAMQQEINSEKDFVITLDCTDTKAQRLRWKVEGEKLRIFVAPSHGGYFSRKDVSFCENGDFDLIISLDAADRKQLGNIFTDNTELFSRVPLIVFDHHASNPGFGTVNIIDTKAASTTEVLFDFLPILIGEDWKKRINPDIATLLLTGIITDTGSFQNANTTPKSLEVSADLVELGGRQQEIIRNIFKTKNIQTLKLWGRVLSKIKTDPIHRMLWSTVSSDDLIDTEGNVDDTNGIIDELLATAPGMEMVLLMKERPDGMITTSVRTTTALCDAAGFAGEFGGGGHTQAAGFKIRGNKPFEVVVGEIISAAQNFQNTRLRLFPEKIVEKIPAKNPIEKIPLEKKPEQKQEEKNTNALVLPQKRKKKKKKKNPVQNMNVEQQPMKNIPEKMEHIPHIPQENKNEFQEKPREEKKIIEAEKPQPITEKKQEPATLHIPQEKREKIQSVTEPQSAPEIVQEIKEPQPDKSVSAKATPDKSEDALQFSEILEKMMNVDPVEAAKNAPKPKPKK